MTCHLSHCFPGGFLDPLRPLKQVIELPLGDTNIDVQQLSTVIFTMTIGNPINILYRLSITVTIALQNGLLPPLIIRLSLQDYKIQQDRCRGFPLGERCIVRRDIPTKIKGSDIFGRDYEVRFCCKFCFEICHDAMTLTCSCRWSS